MNAIVPPPEDAPPYPSPLAVAVRMADEGIPVRAIARSVKLPSDQIYEILREAIADGQLIGMPRDDWPSESNRDARVPLLGTDDEELRFACSRVFRTTRLEASLLTLLLKRNQVTKQQLHNVIEQGRSADETTDPKMVDVVICHLRKKLKHHAIKIETVWGIGYLISPDAREYAVGRLRQAIEQKRADDKAAREEEYGRPSA